jgi:methylated-DNA-[protein]-cysteine S-methyltransferase
VLDPVRRQLAEYLAGRRRRFEVPVDLVLATPFQRQVLTALAAEVAYGRTASYGLVAHAMGRPSASRAVGGALNHNPLCIVLPCHRVIASSGALTGYAGGIEAKRHLLDLEAAGLDPEAAGAGD